MTEITTATAASAAELAAATTYFWGQTSTGPVANRRIAASNFLVKVVSGHFETAAAGNLGVILAASSFMALTADSTRSMIGTLNSGLGFTAGSLFLQPRGGVTASLVLGTEGVARFVVDSTGNSLSITSGGCLGYGTGAGGAVTQATSRTTAVTLNKPCGAITLVSAAGSASWQSFTVNNSLIAATDIVNICQKSGTDKYMIHVTNVAAGSFVITFATTGGTTTEQPVFNFAIMHGATS